MGFEENLWCIIGIVLFACVIPLLFCLRMKKNPEWKEEPTS